MRPRLGRLCTWPREESPDDLDMQRDSTSSKVDGFELELNNCPRLLPWFHVSLTLKGAGWTGCVGRPDR